MPGGPHQVGESCPQSAPSPRLVPGGRESVSETMDVTLSPPYPAFFFWIGFVVFALLLVRLTVWILEILWSCGPPKNLVNTYGRWAVVTGSTDGIGKGYALELARKGMNICLISRNENKLINVANEIKSAHQVDVSWIRADFSRNDIYDFIESELLKIDDIGILVNNVGAAPEKWEAFCNHDRKFLMNLLNINMTSCVMMTQIVLRRMIPENKGLIVNVGSMSSLVPLPYGALYSSTKTFLDNFSLCLATELSDTKIDIQCLRPGFVRTNLLAHMTALTKFYDKVFPFLLPDVKTFSKSAVSTLNGSVPLYHSGYWGHTLILMVILPVNLVSRSAIAHIAKFLMKHCWGAKTQPDPEIYNEVNRAVKM